MGSVENYLIGGDTAMAEVLVVQKQEERRQALSIEWVKPEELSEGEDRNGRIFISDGRIYVIPPVGTGVPATLAPGKSISRLYINGEIVRGPVQIEKGNTIEVVLPYSEPSASLAYTISSNGLQASLAARFANGVVYTIQDAPPLEYQTINGVVADVISPERFTKEQILKFLKDNNVVHGILDDAIDYFCEKQSSEYLVVAKGTPPTPPKDGRIDFKVGLETEKIQTDESEIRVDYRNRFFIPSVKEGDLLAEKLPGQKGVPGKKVTGEEISVREPKEVELKAGKGTQLSVDGRFVYAAQAGRPLYKGGEIVVEPVFVVDGNVDLKQGNVTFSGDILIKGDVLPNFEVNAGRQLDIRGLVTRAKVRSRANMSIGGNIISSKIVAASSQTPYPEIIKLYAKIISTLRKIVSSVYQIKNIGGFSRNISSFDGQYVTQLIDMKFCELPLVIKRLIEVPIDPEDDLAPALEELNNTLVQKLTGYGPRQIRDIEELNQLSEQLLIMGRELEERSRYASANISFPYAQNSQIEATGMIYISRGCYYSNIVAGEGIEMEPNGFFRGGSMTLFQGDIIAGSLGSPAGAKTELTIVKNGTIKAKAVHTNVQVSINMRRYTFTRPYTDVEMHINSDGALEFEGLRAKNSSMPE